MTKDEEILSLHRQLAAETLRADQGWQRYEAKNKECLQLREQLASVNEQLAKLGAQGGAK